ncbi:MAG: Gfo/Idh/MocA family oxidoreductase [Eubacteriales bacterium]|nr:Gfo/Idh/MocA family oxidoreductase [Eubacteriales bacterium]
MKLGILGTGKIVQETLPMFMELELEKIYLFSTKRSEERAKELVERYGLWGSFTDYEALLKTDVDTIYVALPNHLHFEYAKRAMEAGKNVIIEKPVTSNAEEFRKLLKVSEIQDVFMMEAMNVHHLPAFLSVKENISRVGTMKIASLNYSQYSSRYDAFKAGEILPAFDPAKSGGALMDLNVYNIHTVIGLFGKPKKVHYQANVEKGIDTSGILTMEYEGFQAVCIGAKDCGAPVTITLQGNEGYIRISSPVNELREYELSDNDGNKKRVTMEKERHRMYYEFQEFLSIIEQGKKEKMKELQRISLAAAEVMEEARRQAGIRFPADES